MLRQAFCVTSLLAVLAGCATATPAAEARTTYLICGKTVPIDISHDGKNAVVRNADGKQVTLKRDLGFDGVRYTGSNVSVMRQGDIYVFVASDGTTLGCDPLRR